MQHGFVPAYVLWKLEPNSILAAAFRASARSLFIYSTWGPFPLSLSLFIYLFIFWLSVSIVDLVRLRTSRFCFFCLVFRFCCCCWVAVHALIMWTFSFVRCWWCAATVDCVHFTPGTCFVFLMISLLHTCYLCCMPCCIINRNWYLYGMAECLPAVFITGNGSVCCRISDL